MCVCVCVCVCVCARACVCACVCVCVSGESKYVGLGHGSLMPITCLLQALLVGAW